MTIEEAIRVLKVIEEDCGRLNEPFSKRAVKLGIEALQAMKNARSLVSRKSYRLFPGETEGET